MRHTPHIPPSGSEFSVDRCTCLATMATSFRDGALLFYDDVVCIADGASHNRRPALPLPEEASFKMLTGMLFAHTNLCSFFVCEIRRALSCTNYAATKSLMLTRARAHCSDQHRHPIGGGDE